MSEVATASVTPAADTDQDRATFYGVYPREVTRNNQVAIPRQFKQVIDAAHEKRLLLMRWKKELNLRLYTKKQFDQKVDEVKQNLEIPVERRAAAAKWLSNSAEQVEPDSQGRFVIPAKWKEALNIKEVVVFCGSFSYIEIWPAELHKAEPEEPKELAELESMLTNVLNM